MNLFIIFFRLFSDRFLIVNFRMVFTNVFLLLIVTTSVRMAENPDPNCDYLIQVRICYNLFILFFSFLCSSFIKRIISDFAFSIFNLNQGKDVIQLLKTGNRSYLVDAGIELET